MNLLKAIQSADSVSLLGQPVHVNVVTHLKPDLSDEVLRLTWADEHSNIMGASFDREAIATAVPKRDGYVIADMEGVDLFVELFHEPSMLAA